MSRRARITPNIHLHTTLPADVSVRLSLLLFSEVEGCVPRGAIQGLITSLLRRYFDEKELDLAPWLIGHDRLRQPRFVRGDTETLHLLLERLEASILPNSVAGNERKELTNDTRVTGEDSSVAVEGREWDANRGGDDPGDGSSPRGQDDSGKLVSLVEESGAEGGPNSKESLG